MTNDKLNSPTKLFLSISILIFAVLPFDDVSVGQTRPNRQTTEDIRVLRDQVKKLADGQEELRKELQSVKEILSSSQSSNVAGVKINVAGHKFDGYKNAKVTVVEFLDYQCPYCVDHLTDVQPEITSQYIRTGKVKFVLRDFPIHPGASKAAEVTYCAGDQGQYWPMHDRLMKNPDGQDRVHFLQDARDLGLDIKLFIECLDRDKYSQRVQEDKSEGKKLGVRGTPTFFIGLTSEDGQSVTSAQRLDGTVPFSDFKKIIDQLLAGKDERTAN
jgi:protein-disulfide isomerase